MNIESIFFEGQCQRELSQTCLSSAECSLSSIFYQLIQVAIGNRKALSMTPSADEWKELFALSKKQALTAIAMRGVTKLNTASDYGKSIGIDEVTYLQWLGLTAKIAQCNKVLNEQCRELCDVLEHDGFSACVLKGQANQEIYPEELRECRTPGDIDVWVKTKTPSSSPYLREESGIPIAESDLDGKGAQYEYYTGKEAVIRYVLMNTPEEVRKAVVNDMRQHHIDYRFFKNTEVEVHFTPSYFQSPIKNRRLQKWFAEHEEDCNTSSLGFNVGSVGFNAVYQLIHVYKHLFTEGIGLRQLLDYYFVLRALHVEQGELTDSTQSMGMWAESIGRSVPSNTEIMHTLGRFGMKRFASAVMWVLREVFAMPSVYMICEPNEETGRFLLDEIMMSGNFGKYDERNRQMQGASKFKRFWLLSKRNWRFLTQYPSEVLWDPYRRAYNVVWRKLELWKW